MYNYIAKPGGRSSIDITKGKLDKAYALEYLIDKLDVEGSERENKKKGSNTIYLGDEVLSGGGNDYPVTRIEGLLVLAVNPEPQFAPFLSSVIVPSILAGPEASSSLLNMYNEIVKKELKKCNRTNKIPKSNALDLFKQKWFIDRIRDKVNKIANKNIPVKDIQTIYTFLTLLSRDDQHAKKWVNILVKELDYIMEAIDENQVERLAGAGASYPLEDENWNNIVKA